MSKPKMKCVTLSVDIGVLVPVGTDESSLTLDIPHDKVTVFGEGPITGAKMICHTTTGVVDSFTEEQAEDWKKTPLPEEG